MTGQDLINLIIEKGLTQEEINTIGMPVIQFCTKTIENADKERITGQDLVLVNLYGSDDDGDEPIYKPGDIIFVGRTYATADFLDEEMEDDYDDMLGL